VLKDLNERQARKVPENAPTSFVRRRWERLVCTADGPDRRFYEVCVLVELKNALRSGDIWVQGSRQFKDFNDYLLPPSRFAMQRDQRELGLAVETDCERFLDARLARLERELTTVERLAAASEAQEELVGVLCEVRDLLPVPVAGVVSDGQSGLRHAVAAVFPRCPPPTVPVPLPA
jgi:hypothetical protein